MNIFPPLPSQFLWTPQQLSDAVPLRLHHMQPFVAPREGSITAANGVRRRARAASGYLPATAPSTHFRIR